MEKIIKKCLISILIATVELIICKFVADELFNQFLPFLANIFSSTILLTLYYANNRPNNIAFGITLFIQSIIIWVFLMTFAEHHVAIYMIFSNCIPLVIYKKVIKKIEKLSVRTMVIIGSLTVPQLILFFAGLWHESATAIVSLLIILLGATIYGLRK